MDQPLRIAVIVGSLRSGSFNGWLADSLPDLAPPGMVLQRPQGLATFPPYDADVQANGFPPVVPDWAATIADADGVVIVSPEYNFSVPGQLKAALDCMSRPSRG